MNIVHNIDTFIIHDTINNNIINQTIISSINFVKNISIERKTLYICEEI
jgi:predicted transcriptional regulator